jgi:hypothetical protein
MNTAVHSKLDIARAQLKSAVMLFATAIDRVSAITLAGAADVILSQLLLNAGKRNFSDELMEKEAEKSGVMPARGAHGHAVNNMLMINALKHMDPGDDDYLEMDVLVSSLATMAKSVANYVMLIGDSAHEEDFVKVFKMWATIHAPKGLDEDGNPIRV